MKITGYITFRLNLLGEQDKSRVCKKITYMRFISLTDYELFIKY